MMTKNSDNEFFPTPFGLIEGCVDKLLEIHNTPRMVLDAGSGTGRWGVILKDRLPHATIAGIDTHFVWPKKWYDIWVANDYFAAWNNDSSIFNWVVGNPPFKQIVPWVGRSLELIDKYGIVALIAPVGVLAAAKYNLITRGEQAANQVMFIQPRPSFTGDGKTKRGMDYVLLIWRKPEFARQPHGFINWTRDNNVAWEAKFNAA